MNNEQWIMDREQKKIRKEQWPIRVEQWRIVKSNAPWTMHNVQRTMNHELINNTQSIMEN